MSSKSTEVQSNSPRLLDQESYLKKGLKESTRISEKENRKLRKALVRETSDSLNVKFITNRNVTPTVHAFLREILPLGGTTMAYTYNVDHRGNLFMVVAMSICRSDERFDPLIGKEQALARFQAGKVIYEPIKHERLGLVKVDRLTENYKSLFSPITIPKYPNGYTKSQSQEPSKSKSLTVKQRISNFAKKYTPFKQD